MINRKTEFEGITVASLILGATALGCYLSRKSPFIQKIVAIAGTIATAAVIAKNYLSPNPIPKPVAPLSSDRPLFKDLQKLEGLKRHLPPEEAHAKNYLSPNPIPKPVAPLSSDRPLFEDLQKLEGLKRHLPPEEAQTIQNYIQANIQKWKQENCFIFIHASDNSTLPRSIQYNPNIPSVFVHLNREKKGDKLIGEGTEKNCKLTIQYETGKVFARTVFINNFQTITQSLETEIRILNRLNNLPGLIQTIAIDHYPLSLAKKIDNRFRVAVILEKMDDSIYSFGLKNQTLTDTQIKDIMGDVLMGLKSMHDNQIVSKDIHSGNILISIDPQSEKARAKITDFGKAMECATIQDMKIDLIKAGISLHFLLRKSKHWNLKLSDFIKRLSDDQIDNANAAITELNQISI